MIINYDNFFEVTTGDDLSERSEVEQRLSCQKMNMSPVTRDVDTGVDGDSFRSEDSESLALWEEKEPTSSDHGWTKLSTQSPRWLEAMRKFGRSSPVHPKALRDTPRASLDRKPSQRALHDSSKSWYSTATKKIRNGESRSVRSPTSASNLIRQSGVLLPSKWDHESALASRDSDQGNFSRLTDEDTRFTTSAVAWDISSRPESVGEKSRPMNPMPWEIPETEKFVDLNSMKPKAAHSPTPTIHGRGESFFDCQSEYVSCRAFLDDELLESAKESRSSTGDFVNMVDFVAPLLTKIHSMDKDVLSERIPFKWEAPHQLSAEEIAPATEFPHPPPFATRGGFESLRQQYLIKSTSAPVDGIDVILPTPSQSPSIPKPRAPAFIIRDDYATADSFLRKSRSSSDADGPLRRAYNAPDQPLFTKLRKSQFEASRGLSPLRRSSTEADESSSPRSILRGPDDGSVPSSNPSLRSDPGTSGFSAMASLSASQSISSCSASFDLNDSGDYEMTYDLNSTAARIIVESRRVSLSFRDFGPSPPSGEDVVVKVEDGSESVDCERTFETYALGVAMPEAMQSPELWTATFSARYRVCDSPRSDAPDSPCAASERECEFDSPAVVSRAARGGKSEGKEEEQEVQVPIVIEKSRSRNGEFTARLGVVFSPLRLISSHESNHSCFVAATLSPPHEDGNDRSPTYAATLEFLSASEVDQSSSGKGRKAKSSRTHGEKVKSKPSSRRHSSDDSQTMMVTISKAMKKILSKVTVKRSTKKSKLGSPVPGVLSPTGYHLTEVN